MSTALAAFTVTPRRSIERSFCMRVTIFLLALFAQAAPIPTDHYEVAVFRPAVSMTTPFSVTRLTNNLVKCGYPFGPDDPPSDNIANPTTLIWDDPASGTPATKYCKATVPTMVLALPLGFDYRGALRSVAADGTTSAWAFSVNTFSRAPRGLPCPNGQPGILVSGEADLNGQPIQLTICVNR